ncbi:ParA family protein [Caenispirillum salinarum]|uniref:ParA family protein n=1 Tax=Caenispirillum salinarum TaxID=859058 RepID=UPI00384C06DE
MAKRVSIINFKGGVGKTTLAFNFATGIVKHYPGERVLLVDMDHQSSLSIIYLGAKAWQSAVNNRNTVNEIFGPFVRQGATQPGKNIITTTNNLPADYANLHILPASLGLDDIEIELTASHQGNAIHSEWNKRTLLCKWLEDNKVDGDYDYIIFDCPPATKIVSQNAIAASDGYIIPVVPEAVMERGAPHLVEMMKNGIDKRLNALAPMGEHRSLYVSDTKLVGLAVTRIRTHGPAASGYTDDHYQHLTSLQRKWGNRLVEPYIEDGTGVSQALADGVPVYERAHTQNIGQRGFHTLYKDLTDELKNRIDGL